MDNTPYSDFKKVKNGLFNEKTERTEGKTNQEWYCN